MAGFGKIQIINKLELLDNESDCPVYPQLWAINAPPSGITSANINIESPPKGPTLRGTL
jgi:hypothetical protein